MKSLYIFILLFFIFSKSWGQLTLKQIEKKLDSLQSSKLLVQQRIAAYEEQLKQINKEINYLQSQKRLLMEQLTGDYINATTSEGGAVLRDKPSSLGNVITTIPPNTPIKVYRYHDNLYFKVNYNNIEGYVSYSTIAPNQEIDDFLSGKQTTVRNDNKNTTIIRSINENDPKFQKLLKLYGREVAVRIMNNEVWEGMTIGMVLESIGKPNNKTSLNTDEGMKEIWEYNDYRLELLNGSVSKIIKK